MKSFSKITLALTLLVVLMGCRREIGIDRYEFTVSGLHADTARQLEQDLKDAGYWVQGKELDRKLGLPGRPDLKIMYSITGSEYTTKDLRRIARIVEDKDRYEPLKLYATTAGAAYGPTTIEGTANVEVWIDLKPGYVVYLKRDYKKGAHAVELKEFVGRDSRYFNYPRRRGEEYVDLAIVRDDHRFKKKPENYVRISLSAPFKAETRKWHPWYHILWRPFAFFLEPKDDSFR